MENFQWDLFLLNRIIFCFSSSLPHLYCRNVPLYLPGKILISDSCSCFCSGHDVVSCLVMNFRSLVSKHPINKKTKKQPFSVKFGMKPKYLLLFWLMPAFTVYTFGALTYNVVESNPLNLKYSKEGLTFIYIIFLNKIFYWFHYFRESSFLVIALETSADSYWWYEHFHQEIVMKKWIHFLFILKKVIVCK